MEAAVTVQLRSEGALTRAARAEVMGSHLRWAICIYICIYIYISSCGHSMQKFLGQGMEPEPRQQPEPPQ